MAEAEIVIKTIPLRDLCRIADTFSHGGAGSTVPLTRRRALAQSRNPYAQPDDPALLLALHEERCIGYHALLPGRLAWADQEGPVFWASTFYVAEAWRGRGIGKRLVQAVTALGRDLVVTHVTPAAAAVYRAAGFCDLGALGYFQLRMTRLGGGSGSCRHFFQQAAQLFPKSGAISCQQVQRIGCCGPAASEFPHFRRGGEVVNWMLADLWVRSRADEPVAEEGEAGYHFTAAREVFRYFAYEFFDSGSPEPNGFLVLSASRSRRRATVKVLDHLLPDAESHCLAAQLVLACAGELLADRIELSADLASIFAEHPLIHPLLKAQSRFYLAFPANDRSPLAKAGDQLQFDFCDGDTAFT